MGSLGSGVDHGGCGRNCVWSGYGKVLVDLTNTGSGDSIKPSDENIVA